MSVSYHGFKLKVYGFRKDSSGAWWLDLGIGYEVNAKRVDIIIDNEVS